VDEQGLLRHALDAPRSAFAFMQWLQCDSWLCESLVARVDALARQFEQRFGEGCPIAGRKGRVTDRVCFDTPAGRMSFHLLHCACATPSIAAAQSVRIEYWIPADPRTVQLMSPPPDLGSAARSECRDRGGAIASVPSLGATRAATA
jgi:hypothetical protein